MFSRAFWAALSIIAMWLAVLFVGIFGGDFVSSSSGGGFTKIPVVVFLLPFVLPGTVVIGRRAFTSDSEDREPAPEEAPRTREAPTGEPSTLRATHA
jgi:hypothetical protein